MNCRTSKKVLFIDSGSGYGGSTIAMYYILKYLDREKYDPVVMYYFFNDGKDLNKIKSLRIPVYFLSKDKEPVHYVPFKFLLGKSKNKFIHEIKVIIRFLLRLLLIDVCQILRLIKFLRSKKINLIVLNNDIHYHLVGAVSAKINKIPCICRKAGGIGGGKKIKKILVPCADLFIAISKATEEDQINNYPYTKRVEKIYEGVDLEKFNVNNVNIDKKYKLRDKLGINYEAKIIGNISRFENGKGQIELLEAARIVINKYKNVLFLMVGDGELKEELKEKVVKLKLNKHVIFLGWREDIEEILASIDIFVHCPTTWIEGLGIANLEAMAMGKPCIVTNNGGLPDAVIDGITGFVVPIGNINALAEAILKLIYDQTLAKEMGLNGRRRVEENFDIKKNVKKMEKLFEEYI